jgi:hypothetical protein
MSASEAVRGFLKKLPVLREPEVQRLAALAGIATRKCERCAHWDHAAGQRMIAGNVAFARAASILSPSQMEKTHGGAWDDNGKFDGRGQPHHTGGPSWDQLGACRKHNRGEFATSTCEDWC